LNRFIFKAISFISFTRLIRVHSGLVVERRPNSFGHFSYMFAEWSFLSPSFGLES
jgi:hypothetical protein